LIAQNGAYNKTQEAAEYGNGLGNYPRNDPQADGQANPGADSDIITLVHAVGSSEDANID
jgi:hypothetical protein